MCNAVRGNESGEVLTSEILLCWLVDKSVHYKINCFVDLFFSRRPFLNLLRLLKILGEQ